MFRVCTSTMHREKLLNRCGCPVLYRMVVRLVMPLSFVVVWVSSFHENLQISTPGVAFGTIDSAPPVDGPGTSSSRDPISSGTPPSSNEILEADRPLSHHVIDAFLRYLIIG